MYCRFCRHMFLVSEFVLYLDCFFFFFKQKTAYEMRISDWSSDVCSSDLSRAVREAIGRAVAVRSGRQGRGQRSGRQAGDRSIVSQPRAQVFAHRTIMAGTMSFGREKVGLVDASIGPYASVAGAEDRAPASEGSRQCRRKAKISRVLPAQQGGSHGRTGIGRPKAQP